MRISCSVQSSSSFQSSYFFCRIMSLNLLSAQVETVTTADPGSRRGEPQCLCGAKPGRVDVPASERRLAKAAEQLGAARDGGRPRQSRDVQLGSRRHGAACERWNRKLCKPAACRNFRGQRCRACDRQPLQLRVPDRCRAHAQANYLKLSSRGCEVRRQSWRDVCFACSSKVLKGCRYRGINRSEKSINSMARLQRTGTCLSAAVTTAVSWE